MSDIFDALVSEIATVVDVPARRSRPVRGGRIVGHRCGRHRPRVGGNAGCDRAGPSVAALIGNSEGMVYETWRPAWIDDYASVPGVAGEIARTAGFGSGCAVPIVVDGKLWGVISVNTRQGEKLPSDTGKRLFAFTELAATAVANAVARSELIASRARIVAAGDEARRRIERNLRDGTQQRLITLGLDVQRVQATLPEDEQEARAGLADIEKEVESVLAEVRELSRGLHPPMLARGGLSPSLRALARRSPIPVELEIELTERQPASIEIAVYYVVSEALTNAIKHAQASKVAVRVFLSHAGEPFSYDVTGRGRPVHLYATVKDDGVGGVDLSAGSGLIGLADRVDALGGRLEVDSPPGQGTRISVELPIEPPAFD